MSAPPGDAANLSPSQWEYVDERCLRFEAAWQAGQRPRLEEYLGTTPEPARALLLRELLALELTYRSRGGEAPALAEYIQRFPAQAALVSAIFREEVATGAEEAAAEFPVVPDTANQGNEGRAGLTLRLRCPHCHNPVHLGDAHPEAVCCPACGGTFQVREARPMTSTEPMRPLGKFQLLERVGLGAFGAVWKARDTALDRIVALKIPHTGLLMEEKQAERFRREARAAAQLRHPHIVTVHEVVELGGLPTIVSDFIAGVSLKDLMQERQLTSREAAELLVSVAGAVDYAHQMGLVHRDLKPANIMVEYAQPRLDEVGVAGEQGVSTPWLGRPLVMDFGLALRSEAEVTMTQEGVILGTPAYMSPEQAAGYSHQADARSDVYSLGVIGYELLTGERPFRGSKAMLLHQVLRAEPRPPRKVNDKIPRDLETICLKCLHKEPGKRYASAAALADDLKRFLNGAPIQARPVGAWERGAKWVRRRPAITALLAILTLVLVGGFFGMMGLWLRAEAAWQGEVAQRSRTEQERQVAQAVRTFLEHDLLSQADPDEQANTLRRGGGGFEAKENPTIKEVLDRAAAGLAPEKIETKFPQQPLVQASILRTVGNTYHGIGAYDKAVAFLGQSSDTYRRAVGADHPDTLTTLNLLGLAYQKAGRPAEAIALYEQVRDARVKTLGADHPDTLTTLHNLALAYLYAGKTAEAIALYEQVRDTRAKKLGADHPSLLTTLNNLAAAYEKAGKTAEAIALYEQVRDAKLKRLGPNHPATLTTLNNLAATYRNVGKTAEAIALLEQVCNARVQKLGPDHPATLTTLNNLASAYKDAGKLEQALPLFQQAALGVEKLHGRHEYAGMILNNLSDCHERLKQYAPAEAWRRKWLAGVKKRYGPESLADAMVRTFLGRNLILQQKHAEAEPILRAGLAIYAKQQPDAWTAYYTQSLLGGALLGQHQYAEAEPFLRAGYEGMKAREQEIPAIPVQVKAWSRDQLTEALERLIQLYDAWGKPEQAQVWRAKLDQPLPQKESTK